MSQKLSNTRLTAATVRLIFASCLVAVVIALGCVHIPESREVRPGIRYEKKVLARLLFVHIATIDRKIAKLSLVEAKDPPLKTVSALAAETNAVIAVNAGFFTKEGSPAGALKIDGVWRSLPTKNRGVFGFGDDGKVYFDRLEKSFDHPSGIRSQFLPAPWWDQTDSIVGGAPLIIRDKKIVEVASEGTLSSFLHSRYARSAVCVDDRDLIKLVVVDGGDRRSAEFGSASGMTMKELAEFMLKLGCVHALNLDGGYSSSLVLNHDRVNQFSITSLPERPVANALIATVSSDPR